MSEEDDCGDNGWIVAFMDNENGRRRLARYRETYRSDLLSAMSPTTRSRSQITDEMVEIVMNGVLNDAVAMIRTLRPGTQERYMEDLRAHVRKALEKAFDGLHILTEKQLNEEEETP